MNNQEQNTENQSVELSIKSDGLDARVVIKGEGFDIICTTLCSCMEEDKVLEAIIMVAAETYKEVNAARILKRKLQ